MTPALEILSLYKTYQNGVTALHGIDLQVAEGDFFAAFPEPQLDDAAFHLSAIVHKNSVRLYGSAASTKYRCQPVTDHVRLLAECDPVLPDITRRPYKPDQKIQPHHKAKIRM